MQQLIEYEPYSLNISDSSGRSRTRSSSVCEDIYIRLSKDIESPGVLFSENTNNRSAKDIVEQMKLELFLLKEARLGLKNASEQARDEIVPWPHMTWILGGTCRPCSQ